MTIKTGRYKRCFDSFEPDALADAVDGKLLFFFIQSLPTVI